jgi:hypothetical protein
LVCFVQESCRSLCAFFRAPFASYAMAGHAMKYDLSTGRPDTRAFLVQGRATETVSIDDLVVGDIVVRAQ